MIRRGLRSPVELSKSLSKVTLVGGEQPSRLCYGFYDDGDGLQLCPAPGIKAVNNLTTENLYSVDSAHASMGFTLLLYTDGSTVLFVKEQIKIEFIDLPEGKPFSVEARDENGRLLIAVVSADKIGVYDCYSGESDIYNLPSAMYGGVMHCGRLFAVDETNKCKVIWSGLRITDWGDGIDGSGYILLDGDLGNVQRLENFGDNILCVRDYGFTVIRALADSRNFRIAPSQCSVKTAAKINVGGVAGQRYYFSTRDALYCYDGESVSLVYAAGGYLSGFGRVYVLGDGYVYANCVYNGAECLMRYNPKDGKAIYFGKGCSIPFIHNGEMFCSKGGGFFCLSPENGESGRIWRSERIGGYGRKTLRYLCIDSGGSPEITVYCDDTKRTVTDTGRIPVNLSGENIYVEISGNAPVKSVVAELEVRK